MRLVPRWLWKFIPHGHDDELVGGFIFGNDIISELKCYICRRCGRHLIVRSSGLGTDWLKAQGKVQLDAIEALVKKINPDWEYREIKPKFVSELDEVQ